MICLPWVIPESETNCKVVALPILTSSTQCMDPFARAAAFAMATTCSGVLPAKGVALEVLELHAAEIAHTNPSRITAVKYLRFDFTWSLLPGRLIRVGARATRMTAWRAGTTLGPRSA